MYQTSRGLLGAAAAACPGRSGAYNPRQGGEVMDVSVLKALGEIAMNFGVVPAGFLFLVAYFVRQNRELQRQNEKVLRQMFDLVQQLVKQQEAAAQEHRPA